MKAILTIGAAALACALATAPAAADDGRKTEKIIIIDNGDGHAPADAPGVHRFKVERLGDADSRCSGNKDEVNEASPDGKQRTRIMVCTGTQISAAERAEKLEQVLNRLEARDDLGPDQKARVTTALREAISRLRSGQ